MTGYAAFLRGIMPSNPNMRNERLRAVFEGLGYDHVTTLLSSGNVTFQTRETPPATLESRIQKALNTELGIPGGTLIRTRDQLQALVTSDPFPGLTHCRETYLTVTFVKGVLPEAPAIPPESPADSNIQVVAYDHQASAILCILDNSTPGTPAYMSWVEKQYGKDNVTTRTFLTVQKALKKLDS
ncbi:DUF1697 domain-containing protein [Nocardia sp. NPDC020380]|uniref:DUF1697 domain-containing protein n=1 Tax=Nocardia sp. NPDC020380 TaxID=3364309 RepID=UPI003792D1B9